MSNRIKVKNPWQKHIPKKPHRVQRSYYSEHKIKKRQRITNIIWVIIIILLIQAIFQAKCFRLENIIISGNKDLQNEDIQKVVDEHLSCSRYLIFKNNNYFLVKTQAIVDELRETYNLDQVIIKKDFPSTLTIEIKEKISYFIWQRDDSLYLLDAKGALNGQIEAIDDKYLIITDLRSNSTVINDRAFNDQEIDIINELFLEWETIMGQSPRLTRLLINDNENLVELYTNVGFFIKIDPLENISQQLNNLKQILATIRNTQEIDYIDIRFGDKVYFK